MNNSTQSLADQVVDKFRSMLDDAARTAVGNEHFNALRDMVREALSEHSEMILAQLDGVIRQLRAEIDRPDLEL